MTTKRSANRLTRSSGLGASVWAPTVGFATLGMATVAAITMVGLEQGADHVHGTPKAVDAPRSPLTVNEPQAAHATGARTATPATPRTRNVAFTTPTAVADPTSLKHRVTAVTVTTQHAAKQAVAKAVRKTNPAPATAHKGAPAPAPSHAGSGSTSGGSTGTPSQGSGSGSGVGLNTPVLDVKVGAGSGDLLGTGLQVGL